MLNIPNTTAVTWTIPPTSTSVGPVSSVQRVSAVGRERQAGPGFGQDEQPAARPNGGGRPAQTTSSQEPVAVPLLPRETQKDAAGARQAEQQRAAKEMAEQEADKALREKLQTVLTSVWQASAAVVERALGGEPANEVPGPRADSAADPSVAGSTLVARRPLLPEPALDQQSDPLPWPIMQGETPVESDLSAPVPLAPEEIVAYDEKGNTSAAPLEVGSLISHRV